MTVPWLSMEPTSQDHKLVVRCALGGGGQCVLRGPPWSMQAERQGPNNVKGGTSDTLCMPETPQYLSTDTTATDVAPLRGVEFETFGTSTTPLNDLLQANLPCVVCHTDTKLSVLTVPAQYTCPNRWSMEYNGYLMTEGEYSDRQRKSTLCVDKDAEAVPGSNANNDPSLVYLMKATCDGLPCPPYNTNSVLPCAVCSK